jgi:hypothetical protein
MNSVVVTGVTFVVFMAEGLIHYNMGMAESEGGFKLRMPPPKELAKIAAVTAAFSVASGLLMKALPKNIQQPHI